MFPFWIYLQSGGGFEPSLAGWIVGGVEVIAAAALLAFFVFGSG